MARAESYIFDALALAQCRTCDCARDGESCRYFISYIGKIKLNCTLTLVLAVEEVLDPETDTLVPERTYGCLPADEKGLMQCKGHLVPHFYPRYFLSLFSVGFK